MEFDKISFKKFLKLLRNYYYLVLFTEQQLLRNLGQCKALSLF